MVLAIDLILCILLKSAFLLQKNQQISSNEADHSNSLPRVLRREVKQRQADHGNILHNCLIIL